MMQFPVSVSLKLIGLSESDLLCEYKCFVTGFVSRKPIKSHEIGGVPPAMLVKSATGSVDSLGKSWDENMMRGTTGQKHYTVSILCEFHRRSSSVNGVWISKQLWVSN